MIDRDFFDDDLLGEEDDLEDYEEDFYIDEESNTPRLKKKGVNKSEEFFTLCGDEFKDLLSVPVVAVCKQNHELVPYEYSNRILRFKRTNEDVDDFLRKRARRLVMYCIKNRIPKELLCTVAGGNLYDYFKMKNSYRSY